MSKWDNYLHEKNVPNYPIFPKILFSFSYNLVKVQYSLLQGDLQTIHSSCFKKRKTATSFSYRKFFSFPSAHRSPTGRTLNIFVSILLP